MLSLILAAAVCGEVAVEKAELKAAMTAMKRLAAAANVPAIRTEDAKSQDEAVAVSVAAARRRQLEALLGYLEKASPLIGTEMTATAVFNYFAVVRDTVNVASHLTTLPEEALCWERAALNFSVAHHRVLKRQVAGGVMPSQSLDQATAQVALFRERYRDALAKCVAPADAGR